MVLLSLQEELLAHRLSLLLQAALPLQLLELQVLKLLGPGFQRLAVLMGATRGYITAPSGPVNYTPPLRTRTLVLEGVSMFPLIY